MPLLEPVSARRSRWSVQRICSPLRQAGHLPQPACGITTTRSPVLSIFDAAASTTRPTPSWPSSCDSLPMLQACHSVHIGQTISFTLTMVALCLRLRALAHGGPADPENVDGEYFSLLCDWHGDTGLGGPLGQKPHAEPHLAIELGRRLAEMRPVRGAGRVLELERDDASVANRFEGRKD